VTIVWSFHNHNGQSTLEVLAPQVGLGDASTTPLVLYVAVLRTVDLDKYPNFLLVISPT
jgi:hypothetical protein